MRKCIIHSQTGLCLYVVDDETDDFVPPENFSIAPDNTGELYWYWDGDNWYNPAAILNNAYLQNAATTDTATINDESLRIANTFWVRREIEDYIYNIFLQDFFLDGGTFSDTDPALTYNAGYFSGTGANLKSNLFSPLFDSSGGTLTTDIDAGSF